MPREFFRNDHDTPERTGPRVTLGWDRSPGVQVGVVHSRPEVEMYLGELLVDVDITEEQRTAVVEALTQPESGSLGWYTTLGRSEVNRLIRTLRRARDASFGADA